MKLLNLFIVIYPTKLLIRFAIIFAKLLNIRAKLRYNQVIIRIFIFHATEQTNKLKGLVHDYVNSFFEVLRYWALKFSIFLWY